MAEFFKDSDYETLTMNPSQQQGETSEIMKYPMIIKDNLFLESYPLCYDELTQLRQSTHLLQPSKMGQGYQDNHWQNTLFRGL
jgi:hypothetical protein